MDTRAKLLDLAEKSVRRRGFGATSFGDLAQAAGIRKASVHHHFAAKADLGRALVERETDRLGAELGQIAERARTGGDALRALADCVRAELGSGERVGLLTALAAERPSLPQSMQRLVARAIRLEAEWLEAALRRGRQDRSIAVPGDFTSEALAALAQLRGAQVLARASGSVDAFDTAIAPLLARTGRL